MPIFQLTNDALLPLSETSFAQRGIGERTHLQRLLKANIGVVAPDVLVIAEEFSEWEDSRRRIDLLGIDRSANLVVIELKRDEDGGHMELQAIRYAAMISAMTFSRAIEVFGSYLSKTGDERDAEETLLDFLEWDEPLEESFAQNVRIVLVSADFSKELTTAVLWLNQRQMDIQCVRLKPYLSGEQVFIDAQKIIPLPEVSEYQEKLRQKAVVERQAKQATGEDTGFWSMNTGDGSNEGRAWEDCKQYGFMLAGGGEKWINYVKKLKVGDRVFAYLSKFGYVGLGEVTSEAVPFKDFVPAGHSTTLVNLPLCAMPQLDRMNDPERWDMCAGIRWIHALDRDRAVLKRRGGNGTLSRIRQADLVAELLKHFELATQSEEYKENQT